MRFSRALRVICARKCSSMNNSSSEVDFAARELDKNNGNGTEFSKAVMPVEANPSVLVRPLRQNQLEFFNHSLVMVTLPAGCTSNMTSILDHHRRFSSPRL
jgi:hypothetical protein